MNLSKFEDFLAYALSKNESNTEALIMALDAIAKDEEARLAAIAEQKEIKANEEKAALLSEALSELENSLGKLREIIPFTAVNCVTETSCPAVRFTFHFQGGQITYTYRKGGEILVGSLLCESHEEAYREFCSSLFEAHKEAKNLGKRQYGR
jgi:hypothetical protein